MADRDPWTLLKCLGLLPLWLRCWGRLARGEIEMHHLATGHRLCRLRSCGESEVMTTHDIKIPEAGNEVEGTTAFHSMLSDMVKHLYLLIFFFFG